MHPIFLLHQEVKLNQQKQYYMKNKSKTLETVGPHTLCKWTQNVGQSNHTCIPAFLEVFELICLNHHTFSRHKPPTVGSRPGSEVVNKSQADVSKEAPKGDMELQG